MRYEIPKCVGRGGSVSGRLILGTLVPERFRGLGGLDRFSIDYHCYLEEHSGSLVFFLRVFNDGGISERGGLTCT